MAKIQFSTMFNYINYPECPNAGNNNECNKECECLKLRNVKKTITRVVKMSDKPTPVISDKPKNKCTRLKFLSNPNNRAVPGDKNDYMPVVKRDRR